MARESTIQILYGGSTTGAPTDLSDGEFAYAHASKNLFIGANGDNTAVWIGAEVLDEDTMSSDSATSLATQQSIKAYVDSSIAASSAGVSSFNGATGAVEGVSSFNGATGAIEGVSTVNGATGAVTAGGGYKYLWGADSGTAGTSEMQYDLVTNTVTINTTSLEGYDVSNTLLTLKQDGGQIIARKADGTDVWHLRVQPDEMASTGSTYYFTLGGSNLINSGLSDPFAEGDTAFVEFYPYDRENIRSINGVTGAVSLTTGVGTGVTLSESSGTFTFSGIDATTSTKGVASFSTDNFSVSSGAVTIKNGGVANAELVNSSVRINAGSGLTSGAFSETVSLGGGITLDVSVDNTTIEINTDSLRVKALGIDTAQLAADAVDGTKIADDSIDSEHYVDGSVDNIHLANSTITVAGPSSSTPISLGGSVGITGTVNEVTVAESSGQFTIGLPDDVTISGNLTVNGTVTTIDTTNLAIEDPLISLAVNNNLADSVDIGFFGLYDTSGSQDLYCGLFRDRSDSGKFKLFVDSQEAPTTEVNTAATGYTVATLVANISGGSF